MTSLTDQTDARPRRSRRKLIACAAAVLLAGAGTAVFCLCSRDAAPAVAATPESAALAAVQGFLAAATPEARAEFVLNGERILPVLQSYYAGRDPEVIDPEAFKPLPWRFDGPAGQCVVLRAERDRGLPAIVAVVKNESGRWLLDWDLWLQTEDCLFSQFQDRPVEGAETTLRLRLSAEPGDNGSCRLTLADPFEGQSMNITLERPDLCALYNGAIADSPRHATVQMVWLNDALSGTLKPALRRHVCWGFDGIDAQEMVLPTARPPAAAPALPDSALAGADKVKVIDAAVNIAAKTPGLSTVQGRAVASKPGKKVTEARTRDSVRVLPAR